MTIVQDRLFAVPQHELTSDDYYTPAWVFERMGIEFDLDVCSPPGGIPWIPAKRYYTQADDGLVAPWEGRAWMNPPYSNVTPWVERLIEHGDGVCLLPFGRSRWLNRIWDHANAVIIPANIGSFSFANDRTMRFAVFVAAFGDECVEAVSHLGPVRVLR
jgi:hypothetical protein